ncbi:pseudouridine synthase [Arenicella xantha]|nr:pseudouridine synthase [Arenicella xantha]
MNNDKLQKLLAHAGQGSRREIEKWIEEGRITVNGKRAKLGDRASASDRILIDGRLIMLVSTTYEPIKALMYHKPEGEICTRDDPKGRPTVFENLPGIPNGRWVSVGRLDLNTSGLLLFTNSGELANRLMHPSTGLEREYLVRIRGAASPETIKKLTTDGVELDGRKAKFDSVIGADMAEEGTNHWYRVIIREGRYREVRRLWDAVGHTVSRLKRIRYGTVKLTRDVKRGKVAKLAPKQLEKLVASVGLADEFANQLYSSGRAALSKKPARRPASRSSSDSGSENRASGKRSSAKSEPTSRADGHKPNRKKFSKRPSKRGAAGANRTSSVDDSRRAPNKFKKSRRKPS